MKTANDRKTMVRRLSQPPHSGKTTFLKALALGYVAQRFRVLIVVPTLEMAQHFQRQHRLEGVSVESFSSLLRHRNFYKDFDVVLLDDCDRMPADEGDPVALVERLFLAASRRPTVVLGAYSEGFW